jgi:glycolate oxidase iron-sulfur subunit
MKTELTESIRNTAEGARAEAILRKCVHCGFCNATCPTYQILGDELDGPRGRIYLIKSLLEGHDASAGTRLHLDRCLTCRACETTCPSGVEYGALLDIGREQVEKTMKRPWYQRLHRGILKAVLSRRTLFTGLLRIGQFVRPVLPSGLRRTIPSRQPDVSIEALAVHERRVILFQGCVQPGISPETNRIAASVLNGLGIAAVQVKGEQCCGALHHHLGDTRAAKTLMRKNIDRWWPLLQEENECIVSTASGCGLMIKEYGEVLADDPEYRDRAKAISDRCRDIAEFLAAQDTGRLKCMLPTDRRSPAFHCPCTLQHGQHLAGVTESLLAGLGIEPSLPGDAHLCCGSAGTYSILQPELSAQLRHNKLRELLKSKPDTILTANIGCQAHLQQATNVPVRHWITVFESKQS